MDYLEKYRQWLDCPWLDDGLRCELETVSDDEDEIKLRFCADIAFGTAGLRGVTGAGSARMNYVTVGWITRGLAEIILAQGDADRGVVIGRDSRLMSREFAAYTARILAGYGIKVYFFDDIRPTAAVSFALLKLNAAAGINITASHNPGNYNGYKVYGADGAQLSPELAGAVQEAAGEDMLVPVSLCDFDAARDIGLIQIIGEELDREYLASVAACAVENLPCPDDFGIVYTPLFGSGYRLLPRLFEMRGRKVTVCRQQSEPNGNFPGVDPPNPERAQAFKQAIELAEKCGAQLILGTDPDADRLGALVPCEDGYRMLTGNQMGALMCNYILSVLAESGRLPSNGFVVKSLVSTDLATDICIKYGVTIYDVLTGFKYIGEKIDRLETNGSDRFLFGFEESYGYLGGNYTRDKDALYGAMLFTDFAISCHNKGITVLQALDELYAEHGCRLERTVGIDLDPLNGAATLAKRLAELRETPPASIGGLAVVSCDDYTAGLNGLPSADVLSYALEGGSRVVIRPSGTEPKVKLYVMCRCPDMAQAQALVPKLSDAVAELVK